MSDHDKNVVILPQLKIKTNALRVNKHLNDFSDRQVYSQLDFKSAFDTKKDSIRANSVARHHSINHIKDQNSNSYYNNFSKNISIFSSAKSKNQSDRKLQNTSIQNPYFESQMNSLGSQDHYHNYYRNSKDGSSKRNLHNMRKISMDESMIQPVPIHQLTKITLADLNNIASKNSQMIADSQNSV